MQTNKTIVVGDIHGHVPTMAAALDEPYNVVFVGDYLDAFHQSVENQIECLSLVLNASEHEPDRVQGLLGNHEMSYLNESMRCSGYNNVTAQHVKHLVNRMKGILKPFTWVGNYLITHGGVSQEILDVYEMTVHEYLEADNFNDIGVSRGGNLLSGGGLYWNDFNSEMVPPSNLLQVVGHTNSSRGDLDGVRVKYSADKTGEVWCVDNLNRKKEVLMIDGDKAYPYTLDSYEPAPEAL